MGAITQQPNVAKPMAPLRDKRTRARVLVEMAKGHTITRAAAFAGTNRHRVLDTRAADPAYNEAFLAAVEAGTEFLIEEARRRAVEGVRDFRLDREGNEHELIIYDSKLLMYLISQRDNSFRDNHRVEITGGAEPVRVEVEGGRVTGIAEVFALAQQFGIELGAGFARGVRGELDAGAAVEPVPAVVDVLSDPGVG